MPPRKRTESKPAEPQAEDQAQEPVSDPDTEAGQQETAPADPAPAPAQDPAASSPAGPAVSDIQTVDAPCPECFPNGWPEQAFAVGCGHGTWARA